MNRLPAEWAPQRAILLTWPRRDGAFADHYEETLACFRQILGSIARFQPVIVSATPGADHAALQGWLAEQSFAHPVALYAAPSDDVWVRDHGPIGVHTEAGLQWLDYRFDGWGGKFDSRRDDALCQALKSCGALGSEPMQSLDWVLEGGAIETDGLGTLLATRSSVLDPQRNPQLSPQQIEQRLQQELGFSRILWLEHGHLAGDDTDGHIDTLVRFADPQTLLWQSGGGAADINAVSLNALHAELENLRDAQGRPYRLLALPWAGAHHDADGQPLPASYANFLIINGAVLMPSYGVPQDALAAEVLARAFADREIISIDCRPLIRQYGSLHCATMNLPA